MATKKTDEPKGGYATGPDQVGRPVGPEHDSSFHVYEFDEPTAPEEPAAPAESS